MRWGGFGFGNPCKYRRDVLDAWAVWMAVVTAAKLAWTRAVGWAGWTVAWWAGKTVWRWVVWMAGLWVGEVASGVREER